MVTNDATILRLKHDVLYEVAKAAGREIWTRSGSRFHIHDTGTSGDLPLLYL